MIASRVLKGTVVALAISMLTDMLWHNWLFGTFYVTELQTIGRITGGMLTPNFPFIILLELLESFGLTVLVLGAQHSKNNALQGLWMGALIGLMVIGGINFLNHGLLKDWSLNLVIVDTIWGVLMGALSGLAVASLFKKAA